MTAFFFDVLQQTSYKLLLSVVPIRLFKGQKGDELPRNGPQCLCEIFFFYSFVLCAVHDTIFCLTHTFQMLESYFHLISLFSSFRSRTSSQSNPCESLQKTNSS